jgi:lipopolysaccharide transport system permease protein
MSRLVIQAKHVGSACWSDLWRYRGLFFFLSWGDILVRHFRATGETFADII